MKEETGNHKKNIRSIRMLAIVNVIIWSISMLALIIIMQRAPTAKGMIPIPAGGGAVGINMIAMVAKLGRE